jgi:integrase
MLRKTRVPKYGQHRSTGQACVYIDGQRIYLGKYDSEQSRRRYRELIDRWQAKRQGRLTPDISVGELVLLYDQFVRKHYVKNGRPTSEQLCIRAALRFLVVTERQTLVSDFGPRKFKEVRNKMISAGLCRRTVNQNASRIRRLFRWGVGEELVTPGVLASLGAVDGLRAGRTEAREKLPVGAVALKEVVAIRRHVSAPIYAMARLQIRTGMRPGEVTAMRTCDIEIRTDVWRYVPFSHKTEHHGRQRLVFIGPRAQRILKLFLKPNDPNAFLFSPSEAEAERSQRRRQERVSPMTPTQAARQPKEGGKRRPNDHYTVASYRRAIERACESVFGMPAELRVLPKHQATAEMTRRKAEAATWRREHCWHPNQLRHTSATIMRRSAGIETVRTILGHASAVTTEIYAETASAKPVAPMISAAVVLQHRLRVRTACYPFLIPAIRSLLSHGGKLPFENASTIWAVICERISCGLCISSSP